MQPFCTPWPYCSRGAEAAGYRWRVSWRGDGGDAGGSLPAIVYAEAPAVPRGSQRRAALATAQPLWGPLQAAPAAGDSKELCWPRAQGSICLAAGVSRRGEGCALFPHVLGSCPAQVLAGGLGKALGRAGRVLGLSSVGRARAAPLAMGRRLRASECSYPTTLRARPRPSDSFPFTALAVSRVQGQHQAVACRALPSPALRLGLSRARVLLPRPRGVVGFGLNPWGFAKGWLGSRCATGSIQGHVPLQGSGQAPLAMQH